MRINAEISKDGKTLTADTFKDLKYFLDKANQSPGDYQIKELVIKNASSNFTINDIKNMLRHAMLQTMEWFEIVSPDSRLCTKGGLLYSANGTSLCLCPNGRKGTLIIPDGTTMITDFACKSCAFSTVVIPDSVKRIGRYAFTRSYALEEVKGCKNVEGISSYAFSYCWNLKKFPFGNQVRNIYDCAFLNTMLTEVSLPEGLRHVGRQAFNTGVSNTEIDASKMYDIHIPSTLKDIGVYAFANAAHVYTPFVNTALLKSCMRCVNLKHTYECDIWKLKVEGRPDVIVPKAIDDSSWAVKMSSAINAALGLKPKHAKVIVENDNTIIPPELYQYSSNATGLTAALEQCRKYPNANLKRFITRNMGVIFMNLILYPECSNGEEIMISLIKDGVFSDTALKKLLEEIEKSDKKEALATLKAYVLNAITHKNSTFKI